MEYMLARKVRRKTSLLQTELSELHEGICQSFELQLVTDESPTTNIRVLQVEQKEAPVGKK